MPAIRSKSRAWTLMTLYAWETRGEPLPLPEFLSQLLRERTVAAPARPYLGQLVECIAGHRAEIDRHLQRSLHNWRLERLSAIDRNVLRIGAAELLYLADVPPRVAIQEAILLAEKYGTAQSPRFVNGVLDALMRATAATREAT